MSPRNLASLASCGLLCSRPRYFRMVLRPPAPQRVKASSSFVKTRGSFHLSFDPGFMVLRRQSDLMYFDLVSIASIHISDQRSIGREKMSNADEGTASSLVSCDPQLQRCSSADQKETSFRLQSCRVSGAALHHTHALSGPVHMRIPSINVHTEMHALQLVAGDVMSSVHLDHK
ncbi:hypothetical protein EYF80_054374 [Liparis tanakae]|uniref:Uncharacterized protein n=1 Tax=Liparis tanakae TaxID=230148 RepID=A0A4Z2F452_9TELE|nr:hypothetical protein EYF80_054374 [Liparis tanakae]